MLKKVMLQFVALIAPHLIYLFPLIFTFSVFRQEVKLEKNQIIYCYTYVHDTNVWKLKRYLEHLLIQSQ